MTTTEQVSEFSRLTDEHKPSGNVWNDLEKMRKDLDQCNQLPIVKKFINEKMKEEVEQLTELFKQDFGHLPKDDPLRLEVLLTLGELGIVINY